MIFVRPLSEDFTLFTTNGKQLLMETHKVEKINIDGQSTHHDQVFPIVYSGGAQFDGAPVADWVRQHKCQIEAELSASGAIVFKNFGITDDQAFDSFIRAFDWPCFTYEESLSNAVRYNRTELVFTANEAPPSVSIFLHHEMAQTPVYPSKLFFYCERAPSVGGQTPICRSDCLLAVLRTEVPDFVLACEKKGVRYSQTMPAENDLESGQGRSWGSTLSAESIEFAETKLRHLNYEWHWEPDGALSVTSPVLPAVKTLSDGREVFFNQLIAAFKGWKGAGNGWRNLISYGDYSEINEEHIRMADKLADELTFDIRWQDGDIVLVDNYLVMHGRRPYIGRRGVLASLVA